MTPQDQEEVFQIARLVFKELIKKEFGDATPLAKQIAKEAAAEVIREAKIAAEEARAAAKEAKEAAKAKK